MHLFCKVQGATSPIILINNKLSMKKIKVLLGLMLFMFMSNEMAAQEPVWRYNHISLYNINGYEVGEAILSYDLDNECNNNIEYLNYTNYEGWLTITVYTRNETLYKRKHWAKSWGAVLIDDAFRDCISSRKNILIKAIWD